MKYEKLKPKEIAYIAVFGALWGTSEVTFGLVLHNFNIPFSGLLLTLIGIFISLTCVKLTNKKRALIYTALIAAVLKMLSFTTIKLGPIIGIVTAAGIAQIVILIMDISFLSYIIAGGLMACTPFLQFIIGHSIIYSPKIFDIYQDFLGILGLKNLEITVIFIIILIFHLILGVIAGFSAWKFSVFLTNRIKNNETSLKI
jgi:hypothetical protein